MGSASQAHTLPALMSPQKLWVPGVFLLLLGIGNICVGHMRGQQYERVLEQLTDPSTAEAGSSPLVRIQRSHLPNEKQYQRLSRARAKRDFYMLVASGGKAFLAMSAVLLLGAAGLAVMRRR